jgi:capsid assembly protease
MPRAFEWIKEQQWAIQRQSLDTIAAIAERLNESPEEVSKKAGKPLNNTRTVENRDGIAVIPVSGPIMRYSNMFTEISGATSLEILAKDFNTALNDASVKAIVMNIDSPGGQSSGVAEFSNQIYEARGKKPIVAYVESLGASAAYQIASACTELVISETSLVGSIGTIMGYSKVKDNTEGVIVSSQSPKKNLDLNTESGAAEMQKIIDKLSEVFISNVARNRGVSKETVLTDFGQGGVIVGSDAVAVKMADKIGSFEGVISDLQNITSVKRGNPPKEKQTMDLENLKSEYPALFKEVIQLGIKEGIFLGASEERKRIQEIENLPTKGHEAIVQALKFDGKSTIGEVSTAILMTEKRTREKVLESIESDSPAPLPPVVTTEKPKTYPNTEEGWKAEFENSKELQAEFSSHETYIAFKKIKLVNVK